jgi:toxin YoeB
VKILFTKLAWAEYLDWQRTDPKILARINESIRDIARDPFGGLGKPEPLKFNLAGYWSRRIDREHRLVYKVEGSVLTIVQCRYHYH